MKIVYTVEEFIEAVKEAPPKSQIIFIDDGRDLTLEAINERIREHHKEQNIKIANLLEQMRLKNLGFIR